MCRSWIRDSGRDRHDLALDCADQLLFFSASWMIIDVYRSSWCAGLFYFIVAVVTGKTLCLSDVFIFLRIHYLICNFF
jgi:hypothetical protein